MAGKVQEPQSEEEIREAGARIKRMIRYSSVFYAVVLIALFAWLQPAAWGIWIAAFLAFEIVSYPFMIRAMDKATERSIAEFREDRGLTPAEDLPDVGI